MAHNHRQWLEQKFYELEVGDLEEMDTLTDDQLEELIDDTQGMLDSYTVGVEDPDFIDLLETVVNRYIS